MDVREEGELSDSEAEMAESGSAPNCKPTTHPHYRTAPRFTSTARVTMVSSDDQSSSDSDDDDCHLTLAKRPKMSSAPPQRMNLYEKMEPVPSAKPCRKRNNIWANVLGEQALSQEIGSVGLKKLDGDRNVENYDFKAAQQQLAKERAAAATATVNPFMDDDGTELEDGEMKDEDEVPAQHCYSESRMEIEKRLSRKRPMSYHFSKNSQRTIQPGVPLLLPELSLPEECADKTVSAILAQSLKEQKPEILDRVVEVMGRAVAIKVYEQTRDVEREGGMMILNGERRRTSGGVFLQLLKALDLTKEQQSAIFVPDEAQKQWHRRKRAVHRRRQKERLEKQVLEGSSQVSDVIRSGSDRNSGSSGVCSPAITSSSVVEQEEDSSSSSDVNGAAIAGTKCPGSTPVTSPAPSPGPTPATTPVVTPHCSDGENDNKHSNLFDTALAIVKAVSPASSSHYDEDFLDVSTHPHSDEMDVF